MLKERIETVLLIAGGIFMIASFVAFALGHTDAAIYLAILVLACVQSLR